MGCQTSRHQTTTTTTKSGRGDKSYKPSNEILAAVSDNRSAPAGDKDGGKSSKKDKNKPPTGGNRATKNDDDKSVAPLAITPFVHGHHWCDQCFNKPIVGTRYHSTDRNDFDLCQRCYDKLNKKQKNEFKEAVKEEDIVNQASMLQSWLDSKTQFELWILEQEKGNGYKKTTLEQQIDLASRLWDETREEMNREPTAAFSSLATIEALKRTPIQGSDSLVSWKGFRVGWFLNVFCKMNYMQKLIESGCELWFVRKVCIIEMIRQAHCTKHGNPDEEVPVLSGPFINFMDTILGGFGLEGNVGEIVRTPTTFISYTGGYTLQETLEALQQLDPNEYIWMDIFCVNQFAWTGKSRSPEMRKFKETFLDDLQGQIRSIGKTALILEKWNDIMRTLEQIWVLWEIFNTADAGTDLEVLLPHGQTQDFVNNCLESNEKFETIMASLASVDANKARAEDDDDRAKIFERIQESGVSKVNNLATSAMRGWMQKQGMAQLEEQRRKGGARSRGKREVIPWTRDTSDGGQTC